jgi:hypothetical protein
MTRNDIEPLYSNPCTGRSKNVEILGIEAPDWQGVKVQEYLHIPSFRNAAGRNASAYKTARWDASAYKM